MRPASRFVLALVAITSSAFARDWTDRNAIVVRGILTEVRADAVRIRTADGSTRDVARSKLSASDQAFIADCEAHRKAAQRLRVRVLQTLPTAALCEVHRTVTETRTQRVKKWYSELDKKWIYEDRPVTVDRLALVHERAYFAHLDAVEDGQIVELFAWRGGTYSYESVGGGLKTVPRYDLHPPNSEPQDVEQFGR